MNADRLLDRLHQMRRLRFSAQSESKSATGWDGQGQGTVETESPSPGVVLFHESGAWHPQGRGAVQFRNVTRWSVRDDATVRLEHLRFGPAQPVFLLDLVLESDEIWHSPVPHLCVNDRYGLRLTFEPAGMRASWTVSGPKKQEKLDYVYQP
ncbi:MAG: hypothetical protein JWQ88_2492 [Rhodoferax sp.]|nr:hypothetical protein [Rhodoferax sp.]